PGGCRGLGGPAEGGLRQVARAGIAGRFAIDDAEAEAAILDIGARFETLCLVDERLRPAGLDEQFAVLGAARRVGQDGADPLRRRVESVEQRIGYRVHPHIPIQRGRLRLHVLLEDRRRPWRQARAATSASPAISAGVTPGSLMAWPAPSI